MASLKNVKIHDCLDLIAGRPSRFAWCSKCYGQGRVVENIGLEDYLKKIKEKGLISGSKCGYCGGSGIIIKHEGR